MLVALQSKLLSTGQEIANESVQLLPNMMASGRVERNLADLDNAMIKLITVLQTSQTDPHDIAVIASGHGNGLYKPSQDKLKERQMANNLGAAIAAISLQEPWPAQTQFLAALKKSYPLYVFLCKDYHGIY